MDRCCLRIVRMKDVSSELTVVKFNKSVLSKCMSDPGETPVLPCG